MKANISKELEELINEKIYLDLEVHILTNKLNVAVHKKDKNSITYFENRLNNALEKLRKIKELLRKENTKIQEPTSDDLFVEYFFTVKVNGGYPI